MDFNAYVSKGELCFCINLILPHVFFPIQWFEPIRPILGPGAHFYHCEWGPILSIEWNLIKLGGPGHRTVAKLYTKLWLQCGGLGVWRSRMWEVYVECGGVGVWGLEGVGVQGFYRWRDCGAWGVWGEGLKEKWNT